MSVRVEWINGLFVVRLSYGDYQSTSVYRTYCKAVREARKVASLMAISYTA